MKLRRAVLAVALTVLAVCALGALSPAARADGDPGSDVLVYQNLFVAGDSNISIAQQVELGDLLTSASRSGFTIRVAVIATPADLGAITQLWGKPTSYASFLGIELSLAYSQRLLVVMPDGFGFNWQGHSTAAAYQVLGKIAVKPGGTGLATSAETAVRALASASGVRLAATAGGRPTGITGGTTTPTGGSTTGSGVAGAGTAGQAPQSGGQQAATAAPSGTPVALIVGIAVAVLIACALGGWLSRRAVLSRLASGRSRPLPSPSPRGQNRRAPQSEDRGAPVGSRGRLPWRPGRRKDGTRGGPRLAIPGTWLAAGFVAIAVALIALHAVLTPTAGVAQATTATEAGLASNPNLDPGTSLSQVAPNFTLTDQFGQPVSLSSYRGKVVILAFNDSECSSVCPLTTTALVDAKTMLGAAASQVQLLGVNANPRDTSIEDVLSYSQLHGMLYQWRYLTGSLPQLQAVWKDYSIGVTVNQNQIDHEPAVFVINQQGRLAKLYLTQLAYSAVPQLGQLLANEVSSLLPSHPAVHSHLSYDEVAAIGPAAATALPAANGGGYVSLGPGQPGEQNQARLYLFFATWDQEITSIGGQLDALNAYQSAAAGARLPGLTAIDEGSVEPSASALPNFLASLTRPLSYPVAIDGSGQVADGYGVQGEPWFVLASPSGQTLWTWEVSTSGWPSTASLDQHVRAALASAAKTKAAG
jgi:cytochrome oxidase Cu insertion factor (SCO1/SenC/PrrC family)